MTALTGTDVQTGLSTATAVPHKSSKKYATTEIKRFVLETGWTYGIMTSDQKAIIKAVTTNVAK